MKSRIYDYEDVGEVRIERRKNCPVAGRKALCRVCWEKLEKNEDMIIFSIERVDKSEVESYYFHPPCIERVIEKIERLLI